MSSHSKTERSFVGLSRLRQFPNDMPPHAPAETQASQPGSDKTSPFSWLNANPNQADPASFDMSIQSKQLWQDPAAPKETAKSQPANKESLPFSLQSLKQAFLEEPQASKETPAPVIQDAPEVLFEEAPVDVKTAVKTTEPLQMVLDDSADHELEASIHQSPLSPVSSQELYVLQHKLYEAMLYLTGLLANEKAPISEIQPRLDALKTMIPLFQSLQSTFK